MVESDESWKTCDCKSGVISDHLTRTISCSECGLLFGDDSATNPTSSDFFSFNFGNPSNVGGSSDNFLPSTQPNPPHPIIEAFSERLSLPQRVKIRADKILKTMEQNWHDAVFAACIYIACRRELNMTLCISEICSAANGVTPSKMLKAIGFIAEELKIDKTTLMNLNTSDFIKWFCSALKMDSLAVKAALEAAKSSECVNSSRSAESVAAMVVFVIGLCSDKYKSLEDILEVTGVDRNEIKDTYDDLYTHLTTIVPKCEQRRDD